MSTAMRLRNGKMIRCLGDGEGTPEEDQAALKVTEINDLPDEVLRMILQPAAVQMCLSSRIKTAESLDHVYRRLEICQRWKDLLDDPLFNRKIRESVFKIDSKRRYFKSAKPVAISGMDIEEYGDRVAIEIAAGKIFAYKKSILSHKRNGIVKVSTLQRRQSEREAWSICRLGNILIDPGSLTRILQMQFTPFNNQLVILYLNNIRIGNCIRFQYQTDAENPDPPEIWNITQPGYADWMHSSPSTGKVYLVYLTWHQTIDDYGFSDGLHIRSISLDIFKLFALDFRCIRFFNADDRLHIAIGAFEKVVTAPVDTLDEQHLSVRNLPKGSSMVQDFVVDKHNNIFLVTLVGASYELSFAPANKKERVRLLATIPKMRSHINPLKRMFFDEDGGLIFLTFAGTEKINCYRVAGMS